MLLSNFLFLLKSTAFVSKAKFATSAAILAAAGIRISAKDLSVGSSDSKNCNFTISSTKASNVSIFRVFK